MTKEKLYTAIVSFSSGMVIMISTWGLDESTSYLLTLIFYTLSLVYTRKKNRLSVEINDRKAKKVTHLITAVIIAGAIGDLVSSNHFIEIIKIEEHTVNIIRNIVAIILLMINNLSKVLFPSWEAKEIERVKYSLSDSKKN